VSAASRSIMEKVKHFRGSARRKPPMSRVILDNEPLIRLIGFIGIFLGLVLLERLIPARQLSRQGRRWLTNLGLSATVTLVVRLFAQFIIPIAGVGIAFLAQDQGIGIFNNISIAPALAFIISLFALDGLIYGQHVVFHRFEVLWRMHKVHHADPDLDVTTAVRFHPLEILISLFVKAVAILALGVPPLAVITFEVLLNGSAMFNHANLELSPTVNRILSLIIVTPDMHRVHHVTDYEAQNRNFGFNLSLWDRIFGTYRHADKTELSAMQIGLEEYATNDKKLKPTEFLWSLILPFVPTPHPTRHQPDAESPKAGKTGADK